MIYINHLRSNAQINTKDSAARRTLKTGKLSFKALRILSPYLAYAAILVLLTDVCMLLLKNQTEPLRAMTDSETLFQLCSRIQLASYDLVYAQPGYDLTTARQRLSDTALDARRTYNVLLLGTSELVGNSSSGAASRSKPGILTRPKYKVRRSFVSFS